MEKTADIVFVLVLRENSRIKTSPAGQRDYLPNVSRDVKSLAFSIRYYPHVRKYKYQFIDENEGKHDL